MSAVPGGTQNERPENIEPDGELRTFYITDRGWDLSEGLILSTIPLEQIDAQDPYAEHLQRLFPEGLTRHGLLYGIGSRGLPGDPSLSIEVAYEAVRRAEFPDAPSRLCSIFAWETVGDARSFPLTHAGHQIPSERWPAVPSVWRVEHRGKRMRADMNLLMGWNYVLHGLAHANAYWSGQPGNDALPWLQKPPLWEWLLVPPVRVVERVTNETDLSGGTAPASDPAA